MSKCENVNQVSVGKGKLEQANRGGEDAAGWREQEKVNKREEEKCGSRDDADQS